MRDGFIQNTWIEKLREDTRQKPGLLDLIKIIFIKNEEMKVEFMNYIQSF